MIFDSLFNYKYVLRFLILNKTSIFNTYAIAEHKELKLYFNLSKVEDINDVQLYNYFYLIKFFLGRNSFFSKIKKYYLLGTWYYNFDVQLIINSNSFIINMLHYLFNNIIINIEKNLIYRGLKSNFVNNFIVVLKDKNIYSELKTNLGLFNINRSFRLNLHLSGSHGITNLILIKAMKYI